MWHIELKSLIRANNQVKDTWVKQYSYTNDHYDLAKHDIEILRNKYEGREFRLICIDNF
jgi:hypothetical protein